MAGWIYVAVRHGQAFQHGSYITGDRKHLDRIVPTDRHEAAPGPSITSVPAVSESVSVLDSVIVFAVPKTVGSNWITLPAVFGLALAWSTQ